MILSQKELENSVESVRVERDFYYDSLLAIEVSLNNKMKEEPSLRNTTYARDLVEILESPDQWSRKVIQYGVHETSHSLRMTYISE